MIGLDGVRLCVGANEEDQRGDVNLVFIRMVAEVVGGFIHESKKAKRLLCLDYF